MPQLEIQAHIGVGPVHLGMTRSQVHAALSLYDNNRLDQASAPALDYAFGNSLQIEYDPDGAVQFIGVGFYENCGCDYSFGDRHIGDYSAQELFALLAAMDESQPEFTASEHCFSNLIISVWGADPQYDCRGGYTRDVYAQVSVGNQTYLDAIADLEKADPSVQ